MFNSIKPHLADKGDHVHLLGSWTKGGRPRSIPIRNSEQRAWLDAIKQWLKPEESLIPMDKRYITHRRYYDKVVQRAGLRNMHGLRHAYAQTRFKELAGFAAPIAGGPAKKELTSTQKELDSLARITIAEEMGHGRTFVTRSYLA